jgi:hypothetical protein
MDLQLTAVRFDQCGERVSISGARTLKQFC